MTDGQKPTTLGDILDALDPERRQEILDRAQEILDEMLSQPDDGEGSSPD